MVVEVITPAVGEGPDVADVSTTGFGLFKLVWLKMLKSSVRNCKLNLSVSRNFFARGKSVSTSARSLARLAPGADNARGIRAERYNAADGKGGFHDIGKACGRANRE